MSGLSHNPVTCKRFVMFKYAPGMESGLGAALNMMRKHAEPDGDEGTTVTNI